MKHLLTILLTTLTITTALAQDYRWAHGFGAPNGDSHGTGIATDAQGNVYATGFFADSIDFDPTPGTAYVASNIPGQQAMYVAKYDSAGIYQWAFGIDGYYYLGDPHIAVNATGVYVTGCFVNTTDFDPSASVANLTAAGFTDIFLAKYDLNGNYQWAINMGGVDIDISNAIAIDNLGNSYITGYFKDTIADFDPGTGVANVTSHGVYNIFCGKYDINGNYQWAFGFGEGTVLNEGRSISVDQTGVVISGLFTDTIDIDPGVGSTILYSSQNVGGFLVKYNNSGIYQWGFALGGALYSSMIEANGNGGVYACGIFGTDTMDFDLEMVL
ncbi:MAG: hypothetical protein IPJ79_07355 [Bacteroidetes bacterium]|nr:hypothetical protein [Bacteroidota bacterium]